MSTPPVQDRKINRSPRMLRRQIETAHRKNEELRKRIEELNREILSLRWKIRWLGIKQLSMISKVNRSTSKGEHPERQPATV